MEIAINKKHNNIKVTKMNPQHVQWNTTPKQTNTKLTPTTMIHEQEHPITLEMP